MGYDLGDSFPFDFEPKKNPEWFHNEKENFSTIVFLPIGKETSFQFCAYTQRNIFGILLNQSEIRLYLPFFD